jgi:hypothetical protein
MWPKPDANDPLPALSFDHTKFWSYGGPLCFDDIRTLTITDYGADPTKLLCCRCEVQMDSVDDVEVHQTILYHLNMNHAVEEVREMDRLQFPLDHVKRWGHQG